MHAVRFVNENSVRSDEYMYLRPSEFEHQDVLLRAIQSATSNNSSNSIRFLEERFRWLTLDSEGVTLSTVDELSTEGLPFVLHKENDQFHLLCTDIVTAEKRGKAIDFFRRLASFCSDKRGIHLQVASNYSADCFEPVRSFIFSLKGSADVALLRRFPALQKLNIKGAEPVSWDEMIETLRAKSALTSLDFTASKVAAVHVLQIVSALPRLQELTLSCCPNITDRAIEHLATKSSNFTLLDLSDCTQLTGRGLGELVRRNQQLVLDLRNCPGIPSSVVEQLYSIRPLLVCHYRPPSTLPFYFPDPRQERAIECFGAYLKMLFPASAVAYVSDTLHIWIKNTRCSIPDPTHALEVLKPFLTRFSVQMTLPFCAIGLADVHPLSRFLEIAASSCVALVLRPTLESSPTSIRRFEFPRLQVLDLSYCAFSELNLSQFICPNLTKLLLRQNPYRLATICTSAPSSFPKLVALDIRGQLVDYAALISFLMVDESRSCRFTPTTQLQVSRFLQEELIRLLFALPMRCTKLKEMILERLMFDGTACGDLLCRAHSEHQAELALWLIRKITNEYKVEMRVQKEQIVVDVGSTGQLTKMSDHTYTALIGLLKTVASRKQLELIIRVRGILSSQRMSIFDVVSAVQVHLQTVDDIKRLAVFAPKIRSVSIEGSSSRAAAFTDLFREFPQISTLELVRCHNLKDEFVQVRCQLKGILLSQTQMTQAGLIALVSAQKATLEHLAIENEKKADVLLAVEKCSSLRSLSLRGCASITEQMLYECISKQEHLRSLDVDGCPGVSLELIKALNECSHDEYLLELTAQMTHTTMGILACLCRSARSVRVNNAGDSRQTQLCMSMVLRHMAKVRSLRLQSAVQTNLLGELSKFLLLESLWLIEQRGHPSADDRIFEALQHIPTLRRMHLEGFSEITEATIRSIKDKNPQLQKVTVRHCSKISQSLKTYYFL